jgi:hypothetical protein
MKTFLGSAFLTLFSLPFAAIGTVMAYLSLNMVINSIQMSSWPEVPATIEYSELVVGLGSKSTTYSTKAKYKYEVNGQTYNGERVGLSSRSDNVGKFHQEKSEILASYREQQKPFPLKVNPADPSDSILFPQIRPSLLVFYLIFAVVFGGVGYGMLAAAIWSSKSAKISSKLEKLYPNQPWMHQQDWSDKRIVYSSKTTFVVVLALAIFVNIITLPVLMTLPSLILEEKQYGALFLLIFNLIGAGCLYWAFVAFEQWRKFGNSILVFSSNPVRPGRVFDGQIEVSSSLQRVATKVTVLLEGKSLLTTGSGKNRSTSTTKFFTKSADFPISVSMNGGAVHFKFDIPEGVRETSVGYPNPRVVWTITATAKVPGVDYYSSFDIPVFVAG